MEYSAEELKANSQKQAEETRKRLKYRQAGSPAQRRLIAKQIPLVQPLSLRASSRVDGKGHFSKGLTLDTALHALLTVMCLSLENGEGATVVMTDAQGNKVMEVKTESFGAGTTPQLLEQIRFEIQAKAERETRVAARPDPREKGFLTQEETNTIDNKARAEYQAEIKKSKKPRTKKVAVIGIAPLALPIAGAGILDGVTFNDPNTVYNQDPEQNSPLDLPIPENKPKRKVTKKKDVQEQQAEQAEV